MRIAIVYDCLFPHTVGGAERWYRTLAERLRARHDVTYLTRLQWDPGKGPRTPFEVRAVSRGGPLYTDSGRRRIGPPLAFGVGVFWHLVRRGGRYDAVHCASFPYFSLIGAWLALRLRFPRGDRRPSLVADWHEVWSREYWIDYLGPVGGRIGYRVQKLCMRLPESSFTFSRLHGERLSTEGHRGAVVRLTGEYAGGTVEQPAPAEPECPQVVFAARHIPEKRVTVVPDVVAAAQRSLPGLRCTVYGDGPESAVLRDRVRELGLDGALTIAGRVGPEEVDAALARASCLLLPSAREGYGLVVVEALARGVPAVLVAGADNAAVELIEPGVNGFVAAAPDPQELAALVVEAVRGGDALRRSTLDWYRRHAGELSVEDSLREVEAAYTSAGER